MARAGNGVGSLWPDAAGRGGRYSLAGLALTAVLYGLHEVQARVDDLAGRVGRLEAMQMRMRASSSSPPRRVASKDAGQ